MKVIDDFLNVLKIAQMTMENPHWAIFVLSCGSFLCLWYAEQSSLFAILTILSLIGIYPAVSLEAVKWQIRQNPKQKRKYVDTLHGAFKNNFQIRPMAKRFTLPVAVSIPISYLLLLIAVILTALTSLQNNWFFPLLLVQLAFLVWHISEAFQLPKKYQTIATKMRKRGAR